MMSIFTLLGIAIQMFEQHLELLALVDALAERAAPYKMTAFADDACGLGS